MNTPNKKGCVLMLDMGSFELHLRSQELSMNTVGCYMLDSKVFIEGIAPGRTAVLISL